MEPVFFASPAAFRKWLIKNHARETEILVGFYRVATGKPSLTWSESVDQALCFGWIDGVRKTLDGESYTIRFTPRKPGSNWSNVNIAKMEALTKAGLLEAAGARAFAARREARSGVYSFEQKEDPRFDAASTRKLKEDKDGWKWFQAQAPSYRKSAIWWVMSAKKEETKARRLEQLAADNAAEKRLRQFTWEKKANDE
jgi:uncharacterized protein YdeI (YjbR/CyaY-like superfamily)